jgi:hypothetical protein
MADTDRELALRITADAAQAKTELDGLKTSTDSLGAEQAELATGAGAAATALEEQGAAARGAATAEEIAAKETIDLSIANAQAALSGGTLATAQKAIAQETRVVSIAVENARVATSQFVMALIQGGPGAEAAMKKAEVAVSLLAEKIEIAKAAGAPLPKEATDQLESFQRNVAQGSEALNVHAAAAGKSTAALRLQGVAQSGVTLALAEARLAFLALASAGEVGSAGWTAAMGRVQLAVAGVNTQIAAAQKTGGIVTGAQVAGAELYTSRLASMAPALAGVGTATAATAAQKRLLTTATAQAGQALAGGTVNLGAMAAGFLRFAGPVGLAIAALGLFEPVLKMIKGYYDSLITGGFNLIGSMTATEFQAKKMGETWADYNKRIMAAADASAQMKTVVAAMDAGLIPYTADINKGTAEWTLHRASMMGVNADAPKVEAALKSLGVATAKSLDFDQATIAVHAFLTEYERQLKLGENHARAFAEANKSNMNSWMESYEDAKDQIPPKLVEIAKAHDVATESQKKGLKELEAITAAHRPYYDALNKSLSGVTDLTDAERALLSAGMLSSEQTFDFATGLEIFGTTLSNIASKSIPEIITGNHSLLASLESVRAKLVEVDIASTNAFRTGGSSQLSSGPSTGGHTSVGA